MSNFNKRSCRYYGRYLIWIIYINFALIIYYFISSGNKLENNVTKKITREKKKILIYAATTFFNEPIETKRFLASCPETQEYCSISSSYNDLDHSDAVVFHNADFHGPNIEKRLVENRNTDIPYVLWSVESPSNDRFRPSGNFINWTMTYRIDADVWAPYGHLEKFSQPYETNLDEIWDLKTKNVSWLASNCYARNHRTEIVEKLEEKGMKIEKWGQCGRPPPKCNGVSKQDDGCVLELIRPYKFYMSMENSNCKNYVTEKFWKALGERMTIPLVLARKYYKELGVPDSAYIAIEDFKNLDDFVAHVKNVQNNKDLYLSYHKWRSQYRVVIGAGFSGFCRLCNKLQNKESILKNRKSYNDLQSWHSNGICDNDIALKYI